MQLVDTQQLVTFPAVYNTFGYNDPEANELADAQRQQDTDTPEGIAAAEASETYMVENAFAVPVSSIKAVLFSSSAVTNVGFTTFNPRSHALEAGPVGGCQRGSLRNAGCRRLRTSRRHPPAPEPDATGGTRRNGAVT